MRTLCKGNHECSGALAGIKNVTVNLNEKNVTVQFDPAQRAVDDIVAEIEDQGYDVID